MHSLMRCDRRHVKLSMHKSQTRGLFEGGGGEPLPSIREWHPSPDSWPHFMGSRVAPCDRWWGPRRRYFRCTDSRWWGAECCEPCLWISRLPLLSKKMSDVKWTTGVSRRRCLMSPAYSSTYQVYLHPAHSTSYRRLICISFLHHMSIACLHSHFFLQECVCFSPTTPEWCAPVRNLALCSQLSLRTSRRKLSLRTKRRSPSVDDPGRGMTKK